MDELIYILINALIGLFTGKQQKVAPPPIPPRRPANAPPGRPPVRPQQPQQQQIAPKRPPVPQARRPVASQKRVVVQPGATRPAAVMPKPAVLAMPAPVDAPPPTAHRPTTVINATSIRRMIHPETLRTQLVLMEILQPPLSLRDR